MSREVGWRGMGVSIVVYEREMMDLEEKIMLTLSRADCLLEADR